MLAQLVYILLSLQPAHAQGDFQEFPANTDKERFSGYFEFKEDLKIIDREREKGLTEHLEEEEKWIRSQDRARKEYIRDKVAEDPRIRIKEYHEYLADKQAEQKERKNLERKYAADRMKQQRVFVPPVNEVEELDIFFRRPKYEQRNRVLYGAKPSFKSLKPGATSGSGSGFAGGTGASAVPMENMGDQGFVPPPSLPEPPPILDDAMAQPIPPPAIPPVPGVEDGDFPPPPPPPPGFEDGDQF